MKPEDQAAFEKHCKSMGYASRSSEKLIAGISWHDCCEHRDAQASAINEKMLETLHKVLVAGRGSSGRIILEEEHEDLINAAIAAANAASIGQKSGQAEPVLKS